MAAETQFTVITGMVTISTANSNLDGTGTLGTVLTAGANGTKIRSVTIKAKGSTTAEGMVRLFVSDGTARLLAEIEIPVMTQSAKDACFEKYVELDLDLKSGDLLCASTEKADTFNIIAEGLNWSYLTNVREASTNYIANTGTGVISTANSNLDGTGTVTTVFTAGTAANGFKGSSIKTILIKSQVSTGTSSDGMVRLFISDGTNVKLFTEIFVPVIKQTSTERSFVHQIDFGGGINSNDGGFNLAPGYSIIASTELANAFVVTVEGLDRKYPASGLRIILNKNYTPVTGTATLTEELLQSYQVNPGALLTGDLLEVIVNIMDTNNTNTKTFRIYVNSSNTLTGATLVARRNAVSCSADNMQRFFPVISDTALECFGGVTSSPTSYGGSGGTSANITVPSISAGFYILITTQKTVTTDTATIQWSLVRYSRQ